MTAKNPTLGGPIGGGIRTTTTQNCNITTPQIAVRGDLILSSNSNNSSAQQLLIESNNSKDSEERSRQIGLMQPTIAGLLPAQPSNDFAHHLMLQQQSNHLAHNNNNNNNNSTANNSALGVGMEAMQSMDWLFKKERIYLLAQFWQQRATLAEKEVTTLKERMSGNRTPETGSAGVAAAANKDGAATGDASGVSGADAATGPNSAIRSSVEAELINKEKEISQLAENVRRLQASLGALQEAHSAEVRGLEERLDAKRQHIARLEAKLDRRREYEDTKRDGSVLRSPSVEPVTGEDSKHFEQLVIERTKALAQSESIKSAANEGKEPGMAPFGRHDSSDMTEERIAHILSEASHLIKGGVGSGGPGAGGASPQDDDDRASAEDAPLSPYGSRDSGSQHARRMRKYENDDISQEKVARIYQEELAKLMGRRTDPTRDAGGAGFPGLFPNFFSGANPAEQRMPDENVRLAIEAYHRELLKMQQHQQQGGAAGQLAGLTGLAGLPGLPGIPGLPNLLALQHMQQLNGAQDLSLPKEAMMSAKLMNGDPDSAKESQDEQARHCGSAFSLVRPKQESNTTTTNSSASSPLGNSILPPAMTPTEEYSTGAVASPLQRMASITNSLISQPPNPTHHSPSQRPLKAVLPPITQQQFDLFNNLNTEEIVRRVKESLSQYSISQRLFGESVLGLSQGSVSDLLARPKPWHMLTQKGREPFIRMKMFLEDDNAVHKLVASQYKIAPEKLMRTGSYSGSPQCPANLSKQMSSTPKMMSDASSILSKLKQEHNNLLPASLQLGAMNAHGALPPGMTAAMLNSQQQQQLQHQQQQQQQQQPMLLTPPGMPPHHAITLHNQRDIKQEMSMGKPTMGVHHSPMQHSPMSQQTQQPGGGVMRSLHQHISPSVYEMAALTQDLDTQTITTKIKEALLANNIGQKIFGEAVLGLSQGSVSELLSKPKPWHMLSIKGREPFIRMQLWLSDAHNVDRLQALKNERREANKRRRSTGPGGAQDNSSDTSSNDTSEFYHSHSPGPQNGPPNTKKQRVLFSEEQKEALRLAFALDAYPNVATIEFLAVELNLSTRTITNWFHNHRMRLKQQVPHTIPGQQNDAPPREPGSQQVPFDPVQFKLLLNQRLLTLQKERIGMGAVPIPYPPYFATGNLAALIGRGFDHLDQLGALSTAVKEQMSGLDLSMGSTMKHRDEFDSDCASEDESEDGVRSGRCEEEKEDRTGVDSEPRNSNAGRSNRRKPAAPQWVNPDWQDKTNKTASAQEEVIINGVCVMKTEDYRVDCSETVRVEPTPVPERFDDDASDAAERPEADEATEEPTDTDEPMQEDDEQAADTVNVSETANADEETEIKHNAEEERWDY